MTKVSSEPATARARARAASLPEGRSRPRRRSRRRKQSPGEQPHEGAVEQPAAIDVGHRPGVQVGPLDRHDGRGDLGQTGGRQGLLRVKGVENGARRLVHHRHRLGRYGWYRNGRRLHRRGRPGSRRGHERPVGRGSAEPQRRIGEDGRRASRQAPVGERLVPTAVEERRRPVEVADEPVAVRGARPYGCRAPPPRFGCGQEARQTPAAPDDERTLGANRQDKPQAGAGDPVGLRHITGRGSDERLEVARRHPAACFADADLLPDETVGLHHAVEQLDGAPFNEAAQRSSVEARSLPQPETAAVAADYRGGAGKQGGSRQALLSGLCMRRKGEQAWAGDRKAQGERDGQKDVDPS